MNLAKSSDHLANKETYTQPHLQHLVFLARFSARRLALTEAHILFLYLVYPRCSPAKFARTHGPQRMCLLRNVLVSARILTRGEDRKTLYLLVWGCD